MATLVLFLSSTFLRPSPPALRLRLSSWRGYLPSSLSFFLSLSPPSRDFARSSPPPSLPCPPYRPASVPPSLTRALNKLMQARALEVGVGRILMRMSSGPRGDKLPAQVKGYPSRPAIPIVVERACTPRIGGVAPRGGAKSVRCEPRAGSAVLPSVSRLSRDLDENSDPPNRDHGPPPPVSNDTPSRNDTPSCWSRRSRDGPRARIA